MGIGSPDTSLAGRINRSVANSFVGRYFELDKRNTTFLQELRAGVVGFLTVCYIIPVNSGILSSTGGTCTPEHDCGADLYAKDPEGCKFYSPQFAQCVDNFRIDLIASTCISAMIATFLMAVVARMPLAVAPAMGVNAYFTYTVIGYYSTKRINYSQGLACVFVEGFIFLFLALTGVRSRIVELIPKNVMYATAAGIGCFLAFLGLQESEGIGLVTADGATLVGLGGCPPDERANAYFVRPQDMDFQLICNNTADPNAFTDILGPPSANYACWGKQLRSATMWLGIWGGAIMVFLLMRGVRASILYGILFVTFISWIPNHSATYFGDDPQGQARHDYFKKGATVPNTSMTAGKLDFNALNTSDAWVALITFLYLDFMDATSTMFAMARLVSEKVPGFVNHKGQWPRQMLTMCVDGAAIIIGSLMGTSPLTVFAESAIPIREGGRSGITAFVIAIGFGISMFLSPIFASIPPYATGPALFLVGSMMLGHAMNIDWHTPRQAVPAFITIILMPLTYSIAYGVIAGLLAVITLWLADLILETAMVLMFRHKSLSHVYLEAFSHFFAAFGYEDYLILHLPGYQPAAGFMNPSTAVAPIGKEGSELRDAASASTSHDGKDGVELSDAVAVTVSKV